MTKTETILQAGKQIAAIMSGQALKGETLKAHPEDSLNDPNAEKQGEKESVQDPGNPNEVDHGNQDPGQERS